MSAHELWALVEAADYGTARLELADAAHGAACQVLAIKANPPTYNAIVAQLADLLAVEHGQAATGPIVDTANALGGLVGTDAKDRDAQALALVQGLQEQLAQAGQELPDATKMEIGRYLAVAYRLGVNEVSKPLGWKIDFQLHDRDAIAGMHQSGLFWIGQHYGEALDMPAIKGVIQKTMLEEGLGRAEAGRRLAELLGGQIKRSDTYWKGFAATVATRARSMGALSSMEACGAFRYEFVNPMDERTSDVCRRLDGTLFTVKGALKLRAKVLDAQTPDEMKAVAPWPKESDLLTPSGDLLKPSALQTKGIAWPPLHFHCRSTIEVRIWQPLDEGQKDPLGDVDPESMQAPDYSDPLVALPDLVPDPVLPPPWEPTIPMAMTKAGPGLEDWKLLLQLNGYDAEEITALTSLEEWGTYAATDDYIGIANLASTYPPAAPAAFPDALVLSGWSDLAADKSVEMLEVVAGQLQGVGYSQHEAGVLLDAFKAGGTGPLTPQMSVLQVAARLQQLPPGEVVAVLEQEATAQALAKAKATMAAWNPPLPGPEVAKSLASVKKYLQSIGYTASEAKAKAETAQVVFAAFEPQDVELWLGHNPPKSVPQLGGTALPPKPKKPKKPKAAPPPPAPIPAPMPPPPSPATEVAVHASEVPTGPVDAHGGYAWTPDAHEGPWTALGIKKHLLSQGYTAEEADLVLPEAIKVAGQASNAAAAVGQDPGAAMKGALVTFLEQKPPGVVVSVSVKPPPFLSPAELGTRLRKTPAAAPDELGAIYEDHLTGERWYVRAHTDPAQARSEVVANALYRHLGIEVGHTRLVELDGKLQVATRAWSAWDSYDLEDTVQAYGSQLAQEMPVDAWLGNWNVFGVSGQGVKVRTTTIKGFSPILRSDNRGVFAFRATGASKGAAWSATDVPEMDTFLDAAKAPQAAQGFARAAENRALLLPMMDRIAALPDEQIRDLVALGGWPSPEAHALETALRGRRDALAKRAKLLREDLQREAAERARAAAEAEARRAARLARAGTAAKAPRRPSSGVNIEQHAEAAKSGAVALSGDHGTVRQQAVRLSRYKAEKSGKVVHEGFEVRAQVDERFWPRVESAMRSRGGTAADFRAWQRVGFKKGSKAGAVVRFDLDEESGFLGPGLVHKGAEVEIDFGGSSAYQAMKGELRLLIKTTDAAHAQGLLERTLQELTIEDALAAPTEESSFVAAANQTLWNLRGQAHKRVEGRAACEKALQAEGIDPSSLALQLTSERGYQAVRVEGRAAEWRDQGVRYLYQDFAAQQSTVLKSVLGLDGAGGGLFSTVERSMNGIVVSGMSSSTDLGTGGAASVFTRLVGKGGEASRRFYKGGGTRAILSPQLLDRCDWYGFPDDCFGATNDSRYAKWKGADKLIKLLNTSGDAGNELMFRRDIGLDDILMLSSSSESERTAILKVLRDEGISEVRGRPVDEFVVVMAHPKDYSKFKPKDNAVHAYIMGEDDIPPEPWSAD